MAAKLRWAALVLLCTVFRVIGADLASSPFDHGQAEIRAGIAPVVIPGKAPIVHRQWFQGERDLFGYAG